ncbi:MAG: hypothetical protein QME51_09125, partial [Planctomycetota bacterium]|nr:hypothetical protein [Planctomycetota bacterium]
TTTNISVGTTPRGVAVDDTYVWVANTNSNNVTRILKSDLTSSTIAVGTTPIGVAVDETYCWVTKGEGSNNATRIKKSDLTTTTISVGNVLRSLGDMTGYGYDNYASVESVAYLGDNIYNLDAISQTAQRSTLNNQTVSYLIRIQNDGNVSDTFSVSGSGSSVSGWTVSYYDGATDITAQVTGSGYIISALSPTLYAVLRLEVTPSGGVPAGSALDIFITATPQNDPTKKDTVKARTKVSGWGTPPTTTGAPTARYVHSTVWTGSRMLVWGGYDGTNRLNTGGVYDPATNSWTTMTTTNAPSGRSHHSAVWTGSRMIVWGGRDGTNYFNTGGVYDPATNSWTTMTTTGAPSGRSEHSAVWTGTKMIVWGGYPGTSSVNTGGVYDPATDSWTTMTTTNAPSGRSDHSAVWTGTRMIIWGGVDSSGNRVNTGGVYDPATDSWTTMTTTGAPTSRRGHSAAAVWTGTRMIVWGGAIGFDNYTNTGGVYDPATNSWTMMTTTGAPSGRHVHSAVWTGTRIIIWGGEVVGGNRTNTGGVYDPVANSWGTAPTTTDAPTARYFHSAIWTGTRMIIWGGYVSSGVSTNTGGVYFP